MKCDKDIMLLYAVTDRAWSENVTLFEQVKEALEGGVTCVQLREKELDEETFLEEARKIKELCKEYKVPFIINDNVDIAIKCGADGIHVGQSDMEAVRVRELVGRDFIVGVSVQNVEQAIKAQEAGADYLGVGAMFNTSTKLDAKEVSIDMLRQICEAVEIPVVAIGGINKQNIRELTGTKVDGVALVSAIFAAEDIKGECEELKKLSQKMVNGQKTALSIAGSDCSGGAGIQADLKTMTMNNVYAMSVITALTAQNTMGVTGISEVTPQFLKMQLDAVFEDIYPDAVKIGMVANASLIEVIAERLSFYEAKNIVVDPVMVSTSGSRLIEENAIETLKTRLLPMATLVTPNIPEAEILGDMSIGDRNDMIEAAKKISDKYNCAVLLKGGHSINDANDFLYADGKEFWFEGKKINNSNTHGTGCTLSSAIASNLAKNFSLETSVSKAKEYISGALGAMLDLGKGSGPMNHAYLLNDK